MPDIPVLLEGLWHRMLTWTTDGLRAIWVTFVPFVPLLAGVALLLLVVAIAGITVRMRRDRVFHGATLRSVDGMDGTRFEEFLAELFGHMGYHVALVGRSHDFGADLVLTSHRRRIVVQAKRYDGNVGITAVQEVLGAVQYYRGACGMVVTNSGFTESARELAARSGVELWDRQQLVDAMARPVRRKASQDRNQRTIASRSEP